MFFKGDFHTHSTESDGKFSPEELVNLAKSKNIDIMALTDHDTTKGIEAAVKAGEKSGVKVVPAIELSTLYNGESIHVLGYFKDNKYKDSAFQSYLKDMTNYRIIRAKKIVGNLDKYFHIQIEAEKVLQRANGVVARPHIAKEIIAAGYPYTMDYIFNNIINEGSPAYIPNKKLELSEGIKLLKAANALAVLAHPVLVKKSSVEDLMKYDFDGLEAIYPLNKENDTEKFIELAKLYDKIVTAGSDFHSGEAADTKHGTLGTVSLDEKRIEIILKKLSE